MGGGLSNISPMALMNCLRILLIRIKDFGWRKGDLKECIPVVEPSEWPQIASHCTTQEFDDFIKLRDDPRVVMANQATGRQTPVKEYCGILNHSFRETLNRNGNGHANTPGVTQPQSASPLHSFSFGITEPPTITRRPDVQSMSGMHIENTSNRISSDNRSLRQPTSTSTTTSTNNVVSTTSRNQVNVNTVPAQQSNLTPSHSWVYQQGRDVSNHANPVPGSNPNTSQSRGEQNLLSSTMIEPPNRNSNEDSESDSDDPDMRGIFEDSQGQKDFKACMIYWMAKYKERAKQKDNSTAKTGHKINYGRVHPPTLHLESELHSCTFEIWKKTVARFLCQI